MRALHGQMDHNRDLKRLQHWCRRSARVWLAGSLLLCFFTAETHAQNPKGPAGTVPIPPLSLTKEMWVRGAIKNHSKGGVLVESFAPVDASQQASDPKLDGNRVVGTVFVRVADPAVQSASLIDAVVVPDGTFNGLDLAAPVQAYRLLRKHEAATAATAGPAAALPSATPVAIQPTAAAPVTSLSPAPQILPPISLDQPPPTPSQTPALVAIEPPVGPATPAPSLAPTNSPATPKPTTAPTNVAQSRTSPAADPRSTSAPLPQALRTPAVAALANDAKTTAATPAPDHGDDSRQFDSPPPAQPAKAQIVTGPSPGPTTATSPSPSPRGVSRTTTTTVVATTTPAGGVSQSPGPEAAPVRAALPADPNTQPPTAAGSPAAIGAKPLQLLDLSTKPPTEGANMEKDLYSYDGAKLSQVFRLLAEQAGLNYVEPPIPEDETVSLTFRNMTPLQAFMNVARARGFKVYQTESITTLRRPDIKMPLHYTTIKYHVRHVNPEWLLPALGNLIGAESTGSTGGGYGGQGGFNQGLQNGGGFNQNNQGGFNQQGGFGNNGGFGGSSGGNSSFSGSSGGGGRFTPGVPIQLPALKGKAGANGDAASVFIDRQDNGMVVHATDDDHELIKQYLAEADKPEPQIVIETRIVEVSVTDSKTQGIDWGSLGSGLTFGINPTGGTGVGKAGTGAGTGGSTTSVAGAAASAAAFTLFPQGAILTYPQLSVVLRYLNQQGHASAVSQPRVMTRSGVPVVIASTVQQNIETFQPVANASGSGTGAITGAGNSTQALQTGTQAFTTGVTMDVLPRLLDNGVIDLNINPQFSSKIGETVGASGQKIPIISQRSTTASVQVRSGLTVAISGLMSLNNSESTSGIPPLDKIPYVGHFLFGKKDRSASKTNLIIFVTPTVLYPNETVVTIPTKDEAPALLNADRESTDYLHVPVMRAEKVKPVKGKKTVIIQEKRVDHSK